MGKIFAIACMMVLLMSTGLVSGERIAIESYPHSSEADLQINVDNINGYLVANAYVHVDGEERALTCPFGDRHIDISYGITSVQCVSWWDELSQPALDGWNKALKNVDRGTGKELLEDLGKGRADMAGKNLVGMSDDAAEWMAKSEIGRTALKGWDGDAQKGLAEIFEGQGERFTDNLVRRFGGEVEIVSKGVGRGVIDVDQVNPEKLAVYVRGTGKIGVADPLDDIGRHQLVRMMKSPHVTTKVVGSGGKTVEVIDRVAVLKRGSASENWGWEHIVGEDHHNQIKNKFGLRDNDKAVKDFISEGLEKGAKVGDSIIWDVPDSEYKLKIVLSDKPSSISSITSAYPDRGV